MKFIILETKDPYMNLAIEEYLFSESEDDIFMLWQNDPCVVIGKNQNAYAEINREFVEKNDIKIVRRITGGGAVYHDKGNVNYTFISSEKMTDGIDFAYFTSPIIEALSSLGLEAELSGRNDLLTNGKKFSGNAQHSKNGRTLHHGTLLFDSDLGVLSSALHVDEEKLRSKAIKSTRSRVTNLRPLLASDFTVEEFISLVADFVENKYSIQRESAPSSDKIDALRERNASCEWIYPTRELISSYSTVKKKRYPFGIVEVYLDMSNDTIRNIHVSGDFFGVKPVSQIEGALCGVSLDNVREKLGEMCVDECIYGMSADMLADQILNN